MKNFNHFIAIDWAKNNIAIARMTAKSDKITVTEGKFDLADVKAYLSKLRGTKILTIEETTTSQWLYTELRHYVDRIIICDPYRNRLLSEGPKTDKVDACNLVKLLRAGLLKEVFHSGNEFIKLRKIVSAYEDLIKAGVRVKNQRYAFLSAQGKDTADEKEDNSSVLGFVLEGVDKSIMNYESEKKRYETLFKELGKKHIAIRRQDQIPGIGYINSVKIVARVVDPRRFSTKSDYHLYCGLLKYDKISGGRSYGKRSPRYSRELKCVYKTAANNIIGHDNYFNDYYEHLISVRRFPEHQAKHAVARRIASVSYGVFKSGKKFNSVRGKERESKQ